MKIAFFGTPKFAQIILEKLIDSKYKPQLVITAPDAKSGRGRQLAPSPVKQTALQNQIEVLQPNKLDRDQLPETSNQLDLAILVAYGKILPQNILDIPKLGFINVHPSLLPKYRGPSPIHSAILSSNEKTGVSIMKLDEEVDHGPILAQKEIAIDPTDTHDSLAEKLAHTGADLLLDVLPNYISGKLEPKPQNHKQATFTQHISKQDGYFDLENPPQNQTLQRMIKAYYPWPTAWTRLDGKIIKLLPQGKIQPEGKRPMSAKEFSNGYPRAKQLTVILSELA